MDKMEKKVNDVEKRQNKIELKIVGIAKDIEHIKDGIDKKICGTISKMWDSMNALQKSIAENINPHVKDNTYWVGKIKQAIFWIAVMGIGGGLIATAFYLVRHFNN